MAYLRRSPSDAFAEQARQIKPLLLLTKGFEAEDSRPIIPLLNKYVRSITLHQDKLDGSWVEVAPPGNWI